MATYKQLQEQAEKLLAEAEAQRAKELAEVVKQVVATLNEHGITMADLRAHGFSGARGARKAASKKAGRRKSKSAGVAKYQDPKTGATWTGHGRAPNWILEHEAAGKKRDRFLIK